MNMTLLSVSTESFTFFDGIVVAATGILTVLLILFLISVCISIAARIIYFFEHKGERQIIRKKKTPADTVSYQTAPQPVNTVEQPPVQEDYELAAAITAAIAASLNVSPDKLVVRSFRRPQNWQTEAIQEQVYHNL